MYHLKADCKQAIRGRYTLGYHETSETFLIMIGNRVIRRQASRDGLRDFGSQIGT